MTVLAMGRTVLALRSPTEGSAPAAEAPKPPLGRVAVIGAGVSGLAAAYRLQKEGVDVTVFESGDRVGGLLATQTAAAPGLPGEAEAGGGSTGGGGSHAVPADDRLFRWDAGANSMADDDPIVPALIEELGLEHRVAMPAQHKSRYIVRDGKPCKLPTSPLEFALTPLLSTQAKLRILAEPLLWQRREHGPAAEPAESESVRSFVERHLGREAVDYLVDPFCAGTSASSPESLSMKFAFPQPWQLEQTYGSLLLGALKSQGASSSSSKVPGEPSTAGKPRPRRRGVFSFQGGMQSLPLALASRVGLAHIRLGSTVTGLACDSGHQPRPVWSLCCEGGGKGKEGPLRFDAVVLTAPLYRVRSLEISCDGQQWDPASVRVPRYNPVSVVVSAFPAAAVKRPLPGFGVLVPSVESRTHGFKTLGTLFSSAMFPDRAPPGYHLFTTFVGGNKQPELAHLPKDQLQRLVLQDLGKLLGVEGQPAFLRHVFWKQGFPVYGTDYGATLTSIEQLEKQHPFLYYAGNHTKGLAVGKSMLSGYEAGGRVVQDLKSHGGAKIYTMA